jgi:hypothetical protein
MDMQYLIEKESGGVITVKSQKAKDFESPSPMAFCLSQVDLGYLSGAGEKCTTAVLTPVMYELKKSSKEIPGKTRTAIFKILEKLYMAQKNEYIKNGDNPEDARISSIEWFRAAKAQKISKSTFYEAKKILLKNRLVRSDGEYILIP